MNPCEAKASPALIEPKRNAQGWRRSPLGYLGRQLVRYNCFSSHVIKQNHSEWARPSAFQYYFDVDIFRDLYSHELPKRALISIKIDKSLVDAHFPVLPRGSPFAVGTFSRRYAKPFRRKRDRPGQVDSRPVGYALNLFTNMIEHFRARS